MRKYLLVTLLLSISFSIHAQNSYKIQGEVKDTLNFGFTQYTSVLIIRASDSILKSFTRADKNGQFSVSVDSPGKYLMLFENPKYASLVRNVVVDKKNTHLGTIPLTSRKNLIKEVVIHGRQAITIKGDTIEYTADSFKTGKYDNVDELLKKLPGLEVGSDGSIKAYGQKVEKMLVDGDEFFSDDPAMVAKMLRASSVDAVQVFDKKSDQAEFTGIDDGQKIKTINLKLKDNAKRGYFGKVAAGGGLPGYWQNEAMINAFKGKRKMSVYGIMSNTQTGGLGFEDAGKYGSNSSMSMSDDGMSYTFNSPGSYGWDGSYFGQGLPKTWNGGAHYSNSWWGDTLSANGSYNFAKNDFSAFNNTVTQYILPDTQYFNNNHSESNNSRISHSLSFNGEYKIDSLSSLKLKISGNLSNSQSNQFNQSEATAINGTLINENHQTQTNQADNQGANAYLTYQKKFKKKGRSFSASLSGNWFASNANGHLQSEYHLYMIDSTKTIDQQKANQSNSHSAGLSLNYTEPLTKDLFLLFNYNLNTNNQESQINSYNPKNSGGNSDYDVLDSLYSSHFVFKTLENRGGIRLQYSPKDKFRMTVGGDIATTANTQNDLMGDSTLRYNYLNFFPRVSLNYKRSMQSSFSFNYRGSSSQPTISQLQPIRNNDDPLNIAIGNPGLKQSFNHTFQLRYYNYKVLTQENFFISGNFSLDQNAITLKQNMDLSGRRTYQYVNVNGNYNSYLWANYGRKIIGKLNGSLGANINYGHTHNFINNLPNTNNTWSFSPSIGLSMYADTTFSFRYAFNPDYNNSISDIRTDIRTKYWNFNQTLDASYRLPFKIKIGTQIQWNIRQQLNAGDVHNKVFLWNAWVSRSFLKDHSLELKIYANDMLNQNIGYSRVTSADQISESNYNTIQRYFLLSLTWNFTKTGNVEGSEQK